jgi:CRP-like cAMP-binding protein
LSDEDLDQIARRLRTQRYAAGTVILRQGEPGDTFYIVQSGIVTIWQKGAEGLDQKVDQKGPGQYFGEAALVSDRPRNATARALTPIVLLSLAKGEFDLLVRQYVSLSENVNYGCKHGWLLRSMPIFDELNSQQLDWLTQQLHTEPFAPGQVVFHEGERGDKFYVVESGQLAVSRQVNGSTAVIDRVGPGQYVGEIALLQDRPRTATITATEATTLLSLEAEPFHSLMSGYGRLSQTVSKASSRRMTHLERADLLSKETLTS